MQFDQEEDYDRSSLGPSLLHVVPEESVRQQEQSQESPEQRQPSQPRGIKRQRNDTGVDLSANYVNLNDLSNAGRMSAYQFLQQESEEKGSGTSQGSSTRRTTRRRRQPSRASVSSRSRASERGDDSEETGNGESRVARRIVRQEKRKLKEMIKAREACIGCTIVRKSTVKIDATELQLLEQFFSTHYGKMDNDALFAILGKLYEQIRTNYMKKGVELPVWPKEIIKEHYLFHIEDGEIMINEGLKAMYVTFSHMTDSFLHLKKEVHQVTDETEVDEDTGEPVVYEYETVRKVPHTKNIRCGIEVLKMMQSLLKMSSSELAPERKRNIIEDMRPSAFSRERIKFT